MERQYSTSGPTSGVESSVHWFGPRMWTLTFTLVTGGGTGLPQPLIPVPGVGVGAGVGAGVGVAAGAGVGLGVGAGVGVAPGMAGIGTVRRPVPGLGVLVGCVGSSSVIV